VQRVLTNAHSFNALSSQDFYRRDEETHDDLARPAGRIAACVAVQNLDVTNDGPISMFEGGLAERIERGIFGRHDHIRPGQLIQFLDLRIGECCLGRSAPTQHVDGPDPAVAQRLKRVRRDIRNVQFVMSPRENAGHVHRHIAVADHNRASLSQVELVVAVVRMPVVPADKLGRGVAAREVFAGDFQPAIGLRANGVDDRVIVADQIDMVDIAPVFDVAEETQPGVAGGPLVSPCHRPDFRMIWGDAAAHQPEWGRQPFEQIDLDADRRLALQEIGGVEGGRSRPYDGNAQRGRGVDVKLRHRRSRGLLKNAFQCWLS